MKKHFQGQFSNERVLLDSREHFFHFLFTKTRNLILHFIFLVSFFLIYFYLSNFFIYILYIFCFTFFVHLIRIFFCYKNTKIILTTSRVIKYIQSWFFCTYYKELQLSNIKHTTAVKINIFDSIFKYWNIKIQWYDEKELVYFHWLPYAEEIVLYTSKILEHLKNRWSMENFTCFIPRKKRQNNFYKN